MNCKLDKSVSSANDGKVPYIWKSPKKRKCWRPPRKEKEKK